MLTWTREKGHELPEDDDEVAAPRFGRASQGSLQFKGTHGLQVTHRDFITHKESKTPCYFPFVFSYPHRATFQRRALDLVTLLQLCPPSQCGARRHRRG